MNPSPPPSAHAARPTPAERRATFSLALLVWFAVLLQLVLSLRLALAGGQSALQGLVAYLGYFTVLTNILVALVLTLPAVAAASSWGRFFARAPVQACAAISIVLVGLAYHFLLRNIWDPQGWQWLADVLLHYAVPVLFGLYWLGAAPGKRGLRWWVPLAACAYPLAYFAYALVRGVWLGSYPYPFIDVNALGYATVLRNAAGLLGGFVLVGFLFLGAGRWAERVLRGA
ncbi:Pr6Pr family membrane protein [Acidovorax sp. A79]|uniref:Pr6Pr family membrane protein n=1 Tax=Acidovorax sp. A79 TaxID=3056107 RepID=UPI0034E84883